MAEDMQYTNALVFQSLSPAIQVFNEAEAYIPHKPPEVQVSQARQ